MKNFQFKNIMVTGGAGFIGSNFIRHLYQKYPEYQIFNLDLLTYAGNLDNLKDIELLEQKKSGKSQRYVFLKGDICDEDFVGRILSKNNIDAVINFAAESHVDRSIDFSKNFTRANFSGVHSLVDLIRKHKTKRFIQISTDEVYGDVLTGKSNESSPFRPSNPYSVSKAAADLLVQSYMRVHGLPAVIVRGSNNFGPFQYPEKLIPLAITNLIDGQIVPVHGNGRQTRSWLHVADFCLAIDLVMHYAQDFSIYNVSGVEKKNTEIISAICGILGKQTMGLCRNVDDRPGGDSRYSPTSGKIKKELGWRPANHIDNTLVSVVEWYNINIDWWKKIKRQRIFKDHYKKQCRSKYY